MVCHLFRQEQNATTRSLSVRFKHLDRYPAFRIYLYIHEYQTIPEYLNHYVHVFDTNTRGQLSIQFTRKIIFRHVHRGADCVDYGGEHKSKDHCLQSCARLFFNHAYYKFLYLERDNVTMFSSTRIEAYPFCLKYCPNRCNTHYFEVDRIRSSPPRPDQTKADLSLLTQRSSTKDSMDYVRVNFGIFALNLLTILGFLAGFNMFALHNCLQLYVQRKWRIRHFESIDLARLLFAVLKFGLLMAFVLHTSSVFRECRDCETFKTVIDRKNVFAQNLTITFCFELRHLTEDTNGSLDLKSYYLNEHLSKSIMQVFTKLEIYTKEHSRQEMETFLKDHSELVFFGDKKCWKINLNLVGQSGIHMNINLVKYTTLDNYIRFVFAYPYASVYLSEYGLYPNSNTSFWNRTFFRKSIKIFNEAFEGKRCLNYSLVTHQKCSSKFECVEGR